MLAERIQQRVETEITNSQKSEAKLQYLSSSKLESYERINTLTLEVRQSNRYSKDQLSYHCGRSQTKE